MIMQVKWKGEYLALFQKGYNIWPWLQPEDEFRLRSIKWCHFHWPWV